VPRYRTLPVHWVGSFQAEKRTAPIAGALPSLFSGEIANFIEGYFNDSCRCVCERLHTKGQHLPSVSTAAAADDSSAAAPERLSHGRNRRGRDTAFWLPVRYRHHAEPHLPATEPKSLPRDPSGGASTLMPMASRIQSAIPTLAIVRRLELAQPDGFAGDLVDVPTGRLRRFRSVLRHRQVSTAVVASNHRPLPDQERPENFNTAGVFAGLMVLSVVTWS
jgi:hypothetical protein